VWGVCVLIGSDQVIGRHWALKPKLSCHSSCSGPVVSMSCCRCCCCLVPVQVSALEDLWKAAPDAKVEDLDAAEVRGSDD
jgi:hypothetical protein